MLVQNFSSQNARHYGLGSETFETSTGCLETPPPTLAQAEP